MRFNFPSPKPYPALIGITKEEITDVYLNGDKHVISPSMPMLLWRQSASLQEAPLVGPQDVAAFFQCDKSHLFGVIPK
jgi:hypothetical protein